MQMLTGRMSEKNIQGGRDKETAGKRCSHIYLMMEQRLYCSGDFFKTAREARLPL